MRSGLGAFDRRPSDVIKLASSVTKERGERRDPVYVHSLGDCRSTRDLLTSTPFKQQQGRGSEVHVIFEREEVPKSPEHPESTTEHSGPTTVTSRSVSRSAAPGDATERKPESEKKTSTRGRKGKAAKMEPSTEELLGEGAEELLGKELIAPDAKGTVLRKRSLSDMSASAQLGPGYSTRQRTREGAGI
jgi:hypothetical protein